MLPDALWPNLILFVLGNAAAWTLVRTGLWHFGLGLAAVLWIAGDLALVLRFVFDETGGAYVASLITMQLAGVVGAGWTFFALWRRSRPEEKKANVEVLREAQYAWLRGEVDDALAASKRVVRRDPWLLGARVFLARLLRDADRKSRAASMLRTAARIDDGSWADLIAAELEACGQADSVRTSVLRRKPKPDVVPTPGPGSDKANRAAG